MKNVMAILICSSLVTSTLAQNVLCREFGSPYNSVVAFLDTKKEVKVEMSAMDRIVASSSAFVVTYYFNNQTLYRLLLQKTYPKKKEAETCFTSFLNYFELLGSKDIAVSHPSEEKATIKAKKGNRIYEVELNNLPGKEFEIRLTQFDLSISPVQITPTVTPEEEALYAVLLK